MKTYKDIHKVLLIFRGDKMELYRKIRQKATENDIPISTMMMLIFNKHFNKEYIFENKK